MLSESDETVGRGHSQSVVKRIIMAGCSCFVCSLAVAIAGHCCWHGQYVVIANAALSGIENGVHINETFRRW